MKEEPSICEEKIFENIYRKYGKALHNFMFYKCGSLEQSEDFVQESFVRLWKNCAKVNYSKTKSYLFTIAHNLFLKDIAHKKVVLKHQKEISTYQTNENPEFLMETQEFKVKLKHVIASLPDNQREVFLLNRMENKKYREIAEMLEISIKTVEKRMSLALKTLENKLDTVHKI